MATICKWCRNILIIEIWFLKILKTNMLGGKKNIKELLKEVHDERSLININGRETWLRSQIHHKKHMKVIFSEGMQDSF